MIPIAERLERLMRTTEVESMKEMALELEACAINLWNSATLATRSEPPGTRKTLCSVKFFACLLFSIHELMDTSLKVKFRSINCLIRTLRASLDEEEFKLAPKVQEYADREFKSLESLSSTFDSLPGLLKDFRKVKTELFIIKFQFSIIEGDTEMAKFYEERADLNTQVDENSPLSELVLESTRVIFNTCLTLYNKGAFADVSHFLQKCLGYLVGESAELNLIKESICSLLAYSCLELNTPESLRVASDAIARLEQCSNSNINSYKLEIKLKKLQNNVHASEIEDIIMRMLMNVSVMDNFKEILAIINDHVISDPSSAIRCYDYAFTNKLNPITDHDSLEMVFVAVINAYIKDETTPVDIKQVNLARFFDNTEKIYVKPISKKTSSSSVTLLWTAGKSESKNNNYHDSAEWFKLCLHRVVQINEIDRAKVQRALMNCFIELSKFEAVIEIYNSMKENEKKSLITQYNMFKVYSNQGDETQLKTCLRNISSSDNTKMIPLLSLCVVNLQSHHNVAVEAMLTLFKKLNEGLESTVSIPLTLRSVVSLILKQPESELTSQYMETLITLLKEAFKFASDSINIPSYKFTNDELKWFTSQAFNVARKCLLNSDYFQGQVLSEISVDFISLISDDISLQDSFWLGLWKFRAMLIGIMCSCKTTDVDRNILWSSIRERALKLRLNIDEMMIVYRDQREFEAFREEWEVCLLDAILYQFQAELELCNWSASETVINETKRYNKVDFDSTVVNILTSSENYPDRIKSVIVANIVQRNIDKTSIDATILSRWVRLLLKFSVESEETGDICLRVLDQIFLRLRSQGNGENTFPAHEIEWISTSCWNTGVGKLLNVGDKAKGKVWCTIAMKLATFVNERFESTLTNLWDELIATAL